jgi:hypothetical protein
MIIKGGVLAMKRIKSACLVQTVHFQLKDDLPQEEAVEQVQREYTHYKASMDRNRTKYRVTKEETLPDGSILIEIKKQYNYHDCGTYLD